MKNNKLIWATFIPVSQGMLHEKQAKSFKILKETKNDFLSKYAVPSYLCEFELLEWSELDNCNFIEKIIYKLNTPKWILKFIYTIIMMIIGAWIGSLFCN
ncbi:MAG: hypothetical protein HQ522_19530 [Bacteroidetes bacterium]|nr:hypothetical protein [Bacteroidota bacterium]